MLLPLCHPCSWHVYVNFTIEDSYVEVECQVETVDRTASRWRRSPPVRGGADHLRHVQVGRPGMTSAISSCGEDRGRSGVWRRKSADEEVTFDL